MERQYVYFRTDHGCLAGLVLSAAYVVLALVILLALPAPFWLRAAIAAVLCVPMIWPALMIDRRRSEELRSDGLGGDVEGGEPTE